MAMHCQAYFWKMSGMEVTNRLRKNLPPGAFLTRYVDIHSFLYFITQSKLRFARLDTFEDLNEGFSIHTAEAVRVVAGHSRAVRESGDKEDMMKRIALLKQQRSELDQKYREHQKNLFACCWYMGEKESMAMWNLYSNADSVAIRFNANELIDILAAIASKEDKHFTRMQYGSVEYTDLANTGDPDADTVGFLKDDSFSHEQEFRFMAERNADDDTLEYEICLGGLKQIDFTVISHPKMEEWKIRNILNVLSCFELTEKFQPSTLALKNI
jgi:hypothetical protein